MRALALFNSIYPSIGMRRFEPAVQAEAWSQYFHALLWADRLIGHDRDTVRLYPPCPVITRLPQALTRQVCPG